MIMFLSSQDPDDDDDVTNTYLACRRFVLWQLFLFKPSCPSLGIYHQIHSLAEVQVSRGRGGEADKLSHFSSGGGRR